MPNSKRADSKRTLGRLALTALACTWATQASAQEFRLNRYLAPTSAKDGLQVSRPLGLQDGQLSALLVFDYADDPLVLELEQGFRDSETTRLVDDQLQAQARFAYGLGERLVLSLGLEMAVAMTGDTYQDPATSTPYAPADGAGVGDVQLGARYVALGGEHSPASLAVQLRSSLPLARNTNNNQRLSGEASATLHPELLTEWRYAGLRLTGNAGYFVRKDTEVFFTQVGDELTFGAGAAYGLPGRLDRVELLAEVFGATASSDVFGSRSTPVESLLGARFRPADRWQLTVAGGPGLQRGVGSPNLRAIASLGFVGVVESDSDQDGIDDRFDECPSDAEDLDGHRDGDGCPDLDNDGDGVLDADDRCPGEPEDQDGYLDQDGCPDLDNDADGVPDTADHCATEQEDQDGHLDADGCPDLDGDADGVPDATDQCLDTPEDLDNFEDEDGCPDEDNDADGVLDADDACPLQPGSAEQQGCQVQALPAPQAVQVEGQQIRLRERIEFAKGEAALLPESESLLEQIRTTLEQHPEVSRVVVEGHSDSSGNPGFNLRLSEQRAALVVRWLVEHGIEAERLTAWGCGPYRPIADNSSADGRSANRRVELHILEPSTGPARELGRCRVAQ